MMALKKQFTKELDEELAALTNFIVSGACTSFEDYKAKCARMGGIRYAQEVFDDEMCKMSTQDEE